jgi:predicted nucleic acid-binding protein
MSDRTFVDTNILVYAHDADAGEKHTIAPKTMADLWESRQGIISTQVLQELYVTLTRKVASPLKGNNARRLIRNYLTWELVVNDGPIIDDMQHNIPRPRITRQILCCLKESPVTALLGTRQTGNTTWRYR